MAILSAGAKERVGYRKSKLHRMVQRQQIKNSRRLMFRYGWSSHQRECNSGQNHSWVIPLNRKHFGELIKSR